MAKTREIDVSKRLAGQEAIFGKEEWETGFFFKFYDQEFTTMKRVPAIVLRDTAILTDPSSPQSAQLNALISGTTKMLVKEDRVRFTQLIEEEGVSIDELFSVFGNLLQELSGSPLDSSSSSSSGSKKTKSSRMGTLSDELPQ